MWALAWCCCSWPRCSSRSSDDREAVGGAVTFGQIAHYGIRGLVIFGLILLTIFVVLFFGGLASAVLEARRERAAGLEVSRPAREMRARRQALGGWAAALHTSAMKVGHRGMKLCWCGRGPLQYFVQLDQGQPAGMGCAAWEAGDEHAIRLHDAAGGYRRREVDDRGRPVRRVAG